MITVILSLMITVILSLMITVILSGVRRSGRSRRICGCLTSLINALQRHNTKASFKNRLCNKGTS